MAHPGSREGMVQASERGDVEVTGRGFPLFLLPMATSDLWGVGQASGHSAQLGQPGHPGESMAHAQVELSIQRSILITAPSLTQAELYPQHMATVTCNSGSMAIPTEAKQDSETTPQPFKEPVPGSEAHMVLYSGSQQVHSLFFLEPWLSHLYQHCPQYSHSRGSAGNPDRIGGNTMKLKVHTTRRAVGGKTP